MNIRMVCSAVAVAAVMGSSAVRAQDAMGKPMGMEKEKSYTGCLETDAAKGTFTLSHAMRESAMGMGKDAMGKDAMGKDAMGKDAMGKDAMGKDAMGKDAMGKDKMGKDAMGKDAMGKDKMGKDAMGKDAMGKDKMSHGAMDMSTLSISSKQIDLRKHVGHKVTVTGMDDTMSKAAHAFSVTSLKMVAGRCGS